MALAHPVCLLLGLLLHSCSACLLIVLLICFCTVSGSGFVLVWFEGFGALLLPLLLVGLNYPDAVPWSAWGTHSVKVE